VLGLERQGLGWTLAIGAIVLLLAVGLPLADSAVSTEHAAVAGSVTEVGLGVRITPISSWGVVPPHGNQAHQVQFTRAGALLSIEATAYTGSLQDAFQRIASAIDAQNGIQVTSDPQTLTTTSGLVGIAASLAGSNDQGYFAVFVAQGALAVVIADSPPASFHAVDDDMVAMIESVGIGAAGS
jgi:hypothetical protein